MPDSRPNIVLIVADTQRTENIGCYGYPKPTTPNWDQVAAEGVVCEQNIAPGIWSLPSYSSIMTGVHVHTHRADGDHEYLRRHIPTLAETLTEAGYQTCGIMGNAWGSGVAGVDRGFEVYVDKAFGQKTPLVRGWDLPEFEADGGPRLTIEQCDRWLDARDESRPFFLFTIFSEPHATYRPPEPYKSRFMLEDATEDEIESVMERQNVMRVVTELVRFTEREWDILFALNDAEVAKCDDNIGTVLDLLRRRGLYDDAAVILTSDHGDVMGDRFPWWGHLGAICDSLIHVPLVMRYPDAIEPETRISGITQTHDVFATACELAGIETPQPAAGQSRSVIAAARGEGLREFALAEQFTPVQLMERALRQAPDFDVRRFNRSLKAWRNTEWKYVWASDMQDELYDLRADPREHNNLADEHPERAREMREQMEAFLRSIPHYEFGDLQSVWPGKAPWPE
ncbi:MAG: sulfatase, partial [Armatimonadota bacterium]